MISEGELGFIGDYKPDLQVAEVLPKLYFGEEKIITCEIKPSLRPNTEPDFWSLHTRRFLAATWNTERFSVAKSQTQGAGNAACRERHCGKCESLNKMGTVCVEPAVSAQ